MLTYDSGAVDIGINLITGPKWESRLISRSLRSPARLGPRPGVALSRTFGGPHLKALIDCGTALVTVFGKSWDFHVTDIMGTRLDENLSMIRDRIDAVSALLASRRRLGITPRSTQNNAAESKN